MKLLEANYIYFTAARCRFNNEAELFLVPLALRDHICGHGHALDRLDVPGVCLNTFIIAIVLFFVFITPIAIIAIVTIMIIRTL